MPRQTFGHRILWRRVQDWLAVYRPLLVGVAGSSGKSTTLAALAVALSGRGRVRVAERPATHPLDVGLSILGIEAESRQAGWFHLLTRSFVRELTDEEPMMLAVELAAHRPGQLDWLAQQLPVQIGVITSVGTTDTAYFGSKAMVAHELRALPVSMREGGHLVLNADDPLVQLMAQDTRAQVVTFGAAPGTNVHLRRVQRLPAGGLGCEISVAGAVHEVHLPHVVGRHQVGAVLAALAVAHILGMDTGAVVQRLQHLEPPPGRLRLLLGLQGSMILDDSYGASPETMLAALETLRALDGPAPAGMSAARGRRIAILGDMLDLGGETRLWHTRVGKRAAEVADIVVAVGQEMRTAGEEALRAGADVHHFDDSRDVGKWLADFLQPGDRVLVKGSRVMRMAQVVRRLLADPERDQALVIG